MSRPPTTRPTRPLFRTAAALAFCCLSYAAQAFAPQSMRFERLTIEDGLSQSNVKSMVQDSTGFLWLGTESGLNRFDGHTFRRYHENRGAGDALASDFIGDIAVAANGDLWIATDGGGVARWDSHADTFQLLRHVDGEESSLADDHVRALAIDPRGSLWIGTRQDGLDRLDLSSGKIEHFRHDARDDSSLSHDEIYDLALGPDGAIWIATHAGLNRLHPASGKVQRFEHNPANPQSLSHPVIHTLVFDNNGALWVGTMGGGLNLFDPATASFAHYRHDPEAADSLSDDNVQAIFEDSGGRLWVGTAAGLNLMDRRTGRFAIYRHDATDQTSLSSDNVVSLFEDHSGLLWVGTKVAGVNRWNPRSWSFGHVEARPGQAGALSSAHVTSFTETADGRLWVGTFGGGLNIVDRNRGVIEYLNHDPVRPETLSDDRVMALLTDRSGYVWVGTMGGGVNRIDPRDGEILTMRSDPADPESLAADGIMSLFEDRAGDIWIGTFGGGVTRLDPVTGTVKNYRPDPAGLSAGRATAITQDRLGTMWIGTDGGGLNAFDPETGQWRVFRHDTRVPSSISSNTIYSLYVDKRNQLWVGTRAGFARLLRRGGEPNGFVVKTRLDGLSNDTVYGVREDRVGNLWLSTNYGLARYDPAAETFRIFHYSHGLQGEEFNFGAHYANKRGELFFGGSNGFNAFDPQRLTLNSSPPPVVMTAYSKLNKPVRTKLPYEKLRSLEIGYDDDVVTFEFAALDFVAPTKNRYSYFLEGFDKDWVDAGNQRRFTYTNLDAGNYTLHVRAANSDGVWSENEAALSLAVQAPPWLSAWAYFFYALAVGGLIYSYVHSQRRKLEREAEYNRRLQAEVNARTVELADRNNELQVANGRLHEASHTDALTGLRNRRYLFDAIAREIEDPAQTVNDDLPEGRRRKTGNDDTIFIVVDLDRFKPVNDNLGHVAGDQMLLQVRDALLRACRSSDIVIRWGGDEFLVVARGATRADATALVERIRSCIAEHIYTFDHGATTRTTCSIGFAAYPFVANAPNLLAWQQVLNVADTAMYRAKRSRNAWSGIYCNEWTGTAEALLAQLKTDAEALAEDGVVLIIDSHNQAQQEIA